MDLFIGIARISFLPTLVIAHGALTTPITRRGNTGSGENGPVPSNTADSFVCRHAARNALVPLHEVTAGQTTTLNWGFSAAHVGDCAVFISYDVALPLAQQKYFKIANFPKCKDQNRQNMPMSLPSWLPGGNAILRWDWYALHQRPQVEFYAQCVDISITAANPVAVSSLTTYSITNPPVYPANGRAGEYRDPFGAGKNIGDPGFFMTGPACAGGYTENNCDFTKDNGGGGTPANPEAGGGGGGTVNPPVDISPPTCSPAAYVVKTGDNLESIADAFQSTHGVDAKQICDANSLANCDALDVGQALTIPCDAGMLTGSPDNQGTGDDSGGGGGGVGSVGAGFIGAAFGFVAGLVFALWGVPMMNRKINGNNANHGNNAKRTSGSWAAGGPQQVRYSSQNMPPPPPPPKDPGQQHFHAEAV